MSEGPAGRAGSPLAPLAGWGKLAYVRNGDIWVQTLPDGDPRRLTTDGGNYAPRWSASGQWLAYRRAGAVWLLDTGGDGAMPLDGSSGTGMTAWSPAEDRLAYVSAGGDLWTVNAGGGGPAELVRVDETVDLAPNLAPSGIRRIAWSADGQWLAYDLYRVLSNGLPPDRYAGLWRIRGGGGDGTEVYTTGSPAGDGLILAGWSPAGDGILFWTQPMFSASILADGVPLEVVSAAGGSPRRVTDEMLLAPDFLALCPEGNLAAAAAGAGRETWTNKRIVVADLDSGEADWLTEDGVTAISPAWSPHGLRIAYVAAPDEGYVESGAARESVVSRRRVWTMNRDGSGKRQVTSDPEYRDEHPIWVMGGAYILFARQDRAGRPALWTVPADGGEPHRIADEIGDSPARADDLGPLDWSGMFDYWHSPAP